MRHLNRPAVRILLLGAVIVLPGCGGDDTNGTTATATRGEAATGRSCPDVPVPGHRALDLRATGPTCSVATAVARDAGGRGRARYSSSGFMCTPTDAPAGDTYYACRRDGDRITFRYGAV